MPENNSYTVERRGKRQKVDLRIQMIYLKNGLQESIHGIGSDLSEGGLAIYAAADVEEGQHVKIEFTIPYSRRHLWIEAIVRNKHGYRYGLEFLTLSSSQREEISKLCHTASLMNPA